MYIWGIVWIVQVCGYIRVLIEWFCCKSMFFVCCGVLGGGLGGGRFWDRGCFLCLRIVIWFFCWEMCKMEVFLHFLMVRLLFILLIVDVGTSMYAFLSFSLFLIWSVQPGWRYRLRFVWYCKCVTCIFGKNVCLVYLYLFVFVFK